MTAGQRDNETTGTEAFHSRGLVVPLSRCRFYRYPVKSMGGEMIERPWIDERGLIGDRAYAIIDRATGHVASAKHASRWGELLQCSASYVDEPRRGTPPPPVMITLPDGSTIQSDHSDVDARLSLLLGRDVSLTTQAPSSPIREADRSPHEGPEGQLIVEEPMGLASPAGTFFDHAPIHIVTTATLRHLQQLLPSTRIDARRFRPNIVIDVEGDRFVENEWAGREMRIGDDLYLKIIDPTPRCIVTTLPQPGLEKDREILRTIARESEAASATIAPGVMLPGVIGVYAGTPPAR